MTCLKSLQLNIKLYPFPDKRVQSTFFLAWWKLLNSVFTMQTQYEIFWVESTKQNLQILHSYVLSSSKFSFKSSELPSEVHFFSKLSLNLVLWTQYLSPKKIALLGDWVLHSFQWVPRFFLNLGRMHLTETVPNMVCLFGKGYIQFHVNFYKLVLFHVTIIPIEWTH